MPKISEIDQKDLEFIEAVKKYAKNPKGFFLIAGKNGRGKSFTAEAIYEANARYKLPYKDWEEAIFITQAELNQLFLKSYSDYSNAHELSETFSRTKLLVLDDMGSTRTPTDAFWDFIYLIMDRRYANRKFCGTVITTNLNSEDMRLKYGDAIISRIASNIVFRVEGPDRRFKDF